MNSSTITQLVRILAYAGGSAYFGNEIADGDLFQAAIGGLVSIAAFVWWAVVESKKPAQ